MALDSTFWIDAAGGPKWVAASLASSGMYRPADRPKGALVAPGVLTIVDPAEGGDPRIVEAAISAQVRVFFVNTDKSQSAQWTLNTVRSVMLLLAASDADAFFLYCSDSPALLRRNGKLMLDRRCGLWKPGVVPEVLPMVTMDYSWGDVPFS